MIPYFRFTVIPIGPLVIQVWGLMVAIGIALAVYVGRKACVRRGLDKEAFTDFASWAVLGALVGARLGHVLAYEPMTYLADPLRVFRVWEGGMSIIGGLIGGAAAAAWYARKAKLRFFRYADVAAYALPLGYGCGRIGCFLIHDHPGTLSHSWLAVQYPGGARLDHGLLLSLVGFLMFGAFWLRERRKPWTGFLPAFMICYGLTRFFLDFLRATDLPGSDARYYGLTPAQYAGAALVILGIAVWRRRKSLYAIPL